MSFPVQVFGHGAMSDLSPECAAERTSSCAAKRPSVVRVRAARYRTHPPIITPPAWALLARVWRYGYFRPVGGSTTTPSQTIRSSISLNWSLSYPGSVSPGFTGSNSARP